LSEDKKQDRGLTYLTPDGHVHPSITKIDQYDKFINAVYLAASGALRKIESDINVNPEKVDLHLVDALGEMVNLYNDLSCGVDGFRSKQLAKIGSSNAYVPQDEDERGWLQRNFTKRKKEEVASEG